jgi:hypothetical protein
MTQSGHSGCLGSHDFFDVGKHPRLVEQSLLGAVEAEQGFNLSIGAASVAPLRDDFRPRLAVA